MHERLQDYITKTNILYPNQFGFQSGRSTSMALLDMHDKISQAFDNNEFSIGIFFDLAKAFDTVDHSILLNKLEFYGVRGIPLCCFKNYLSNRQQQVSYNGTLSDMKFIQ